MMNGIAYDGLFRVEGATFLVFADYCRASIRVAAISHLPTVYIFTHDRSPFPHPSVSVAMLPAPPPLPMRSPQRGTEFIIVSPRRNLCNCTGFCMFPPVFFRLSPIPVSVPQAKSCFCC